MFFFYNEFVNERKIGDISNKIQNSQLALDKTNQARLDLIEAQNLLLQSFYKDSNIKDYYAAIDRLNTNVDSLNNFTTSNKNSVSSLKLIDSLNNSNLLFKAKIDSILQNKNILDKTKQNNLFNFSNPDFKQVISNVKVDSYIMVDSVAKKGLFSRIGDAVKGKTPVQKEKVNVLITLTIGDKTTTGNVEDQIKNIFESTQNNYITQLQKFRNNDLISNQAILFFSNTLLKLYDKTISEIYKNNVEQLKNQTSKNKKIRFGVLIAVVFLMICISIGIFVLTSFAFEYEKKLELSNKIIQKNNQFKSRIIAMISHEIRAPLHIASIYTTKIGNKIADASVSDFFKSLQFTLQSTLLLTNQILEYSKLEQKKMKLSNTSFDLTSEITGVLSSLTELVALNNNQLLVHNQLPQQLDVTTDKARIEQLFYNLICNANKFTSNGKIEVTIFAGNIVNNHYKLKVSIQDNGSGVAKEDLPFVFDNYYQGNKPQSNSHTSAGLGLNLCKEIVTLFKGSISLESIINQGATVTFTIFIPVNTI